MKAYRAPLFAAVLLIATPGAGAEVSVASLQDEDRLSLAVELEPAANIVVGQRVKLLLTVGTDRWFAGGTRIGLPEVPGLVILQTAKFASNSSETRNGSNWVLQRWTLDLYPQRPGTFTLPAIEVQVSVNHEEAGVVSGALSSAPLTFRAAVPAALETVEQWVAAPAFTVTQRLDREEPLRLAPGDALEREIRFEASDVLAMMLPRFEPESQDGLASYPLPPVLDNRLNRGEARASRVERISYVAQQPGDYTLPAREYSWWDTRRGELHLLQLPAIAISVSGEAPAGDRAQHRWLDRRALMLGGAAAALLVFLWWWLRRLSLPWQRLATVLRHARERWRRWRQPALPQRLNPGNSAAD